MPTTPVAGRILLDGRPIGARWVEVMPVDGTKGRLTSAPVAADGSFTVERMPVGVVGMKLAGPPLRGSGEPRLDEFLRQARSQFLIRRDIPSGPNPPLIVDFRTEPGRLQAYLQRLARRQGDAPP